MKKFFDKFKQSFSPKCQLNGITMTIARINFSLLILVASLTNYLLVKYKKVYKKLYPKLRWNTDISLKKYLKYIKHALQNLEQESLIDHVANHKHNLIQKKEKSAKALSAVKL